MEWIFSGIGNYPIRAFFNYLSNLFDNSKNKQETEKPTCRLNFSLEINKQPKNKDTRKKMKKKENAISINSFNISFPTSENLILVSVIVILSLFVVAIFSTFFLFNYFYRAMIFFFCIILFYFLFRLFIQIQNLDLKLSKSFDKKKISDYQSYYIEPTCNTKKNFYSKPNQSKIFSKLDNLFFKDEKKDIILILANAGMGKTSLLINYYKYNKKFFNINRTLKFILLPLRIYVVPLNMSDVEEKLKNITNKKNTILCLDALDEDIKAVTEDYRGRLKSFIELRNEFKRVVITCRKNFFESTDITVFFDNYDFLQIEICTFNDEDVDKYIINHFKWWNTFSRKKKITEAKRLKDKLFSKDTSFEYSPLIISNIPKLIKDNTKHNAIYESEHCPIYLLYETMIEKRIDHILEKYKSNTGLTKKKLNDIFENLAYEIFTDTNFLVSKNILYDKLKFIPSKTTKQSLITSITDKCILEKQPNGYYDFTHRTITEFLFVKKFLSLNFDERMKISWSTQMKEFVRDSIMLKNFDNFSKTDLSNEDELFCSLEWPDNTKLKDANLSYSNFEESYLIGADFDFANLNETNLSVNKISGASFKNAQNVPEWIAKGLNSEQKFDKTILIDKIKKEGYDSKSKLTLKDETFTKTNFSNKKLSNIYFIECTFEDVNFEKTYFYHIYFTKTIFKNVNFEGATFKEVDLNIDWIKVGINSDHIFSQERLIKAIKQHNITNLQYISLKNANLTNLELNKLDFSYASLENTDFSNSTLFEINFANARLVKANFENTTTKYTYFEGANLKDAINLPGWIEAGKNAEDTFSYKKLLSQINSERVASISLASANLSYQNLNSFNLQEVELCNANLREANLCNSILEGSTLKNADLKNANLKNANLSETNLAEANFDYANLSFANLWKANFYKASFRGANLLGADLTYSNDLTFGQLKGVKSLNNSKIDQILKEELINNGFGSLFDSNEEN